MKKTVRAGIIGSGFAAQFHLEALQQVSVALIHVVGVYSRNPQNAENFALKNGLTSFYSLEELIDSCDVLHVCTSPVSHEEITIQVLKKDKDVIIEKPLTGYFGSGKNFNGDTFSRKTGLDYAVASVKRMLEAENSSKGMIMYAENWIYAPAIQKEREVVEKTNAQILWIQAQQGHSGSHSLDYGKWKFSGGGSLMGKGCHPLSAAIYLKGVEGKVLNGKPIRPKTVSCKTHSITRLPGFKNQGHLKDSYTDVEDYASLHLVFEDGTIADIVASELVHGGVKNYLEVHANNHRTICNLTPNNAMQTYNPVDTNFTDIYVSEKLGTKQGWFNISPDESWFNGYQHELDAFYKCHISRISAESNSLLAADVIVTIYSAYLSASCKGEEVPIDL
ncbi:Gfo/Idh/MocA family protein [Flavimarina sp. Hel_I_48]|uniref:Gfo/Idh/MocA family protein n=1 Tax=Flavimarina sp. Hel_I_48 TaxID=1392488 RepID=UPI000AC71231|nr:Gfo/Idh/MocA family oxidoreductase [Flavimarina sp. Hel_I_48]